MTDSQLDRLEGMMAARDLVERMREQRSRRYENLALPADRPRDPRRWSEERARVAASVLWLGKAVEAIEQAMYDFHEKECR